MANKSHIERLHSPDLVTTYEQTAKGKGVIASPLEYDELMQIVPKGKLVTIEELQTALAKKHKVDYSSSQFARLYINMVAQASVEQMVLGSRNATPYWRTLRRNGELNESYPGGIEAHRLKLELEGHTVILKGKRYFVQNYQQQLCRL